MNDIWKRTVLRVYGVTPSAIRVRLVRLFTPNYTAGVVTLVVRPNGDVLFLEPTYRKGWGLPGGLMDRHELPEVAAQREVREELGIEIGLPSVYRTSVNARSHMVTFFTMVHIDDEQANAIATDPVEVAAMHWFAPTAMPALDAEVAALESADRLAVEALVEKKR